jgi:hypothetical protein
LVVVPASPALLLCVLIFPFYQLLHNLIGKELIEYRAKGSLRSISGGRLGWPWSSKSLIWKGLKSGSGQGLGGQVFAM